MALLWMDGFDAGDCNAKGYVGSWQATGSSSPNTRYGTGRWAAIVAVGNVTVYKSLATPVNKIYTGFAWASNAINAAGSRPRMGIGGDGGGNTHLSITFNNGNVNLYRGDFATFITSATGNFAVNTFYFMEISATIHDTTGTCEIRINGNTIINYTGDTRNGGGSTIDKVFFTALSGDNLYIDDFYICDDSGSAPHNNFLGDVRVYTMSPSAAGNSTQFTPSTGANYTTVDEIPYSTSDYVTAVAPTTKDTYTMSDLPASAATIFGVQTNVIAKKTDAGAISLKPIVRSGSTDYSGTTTSLSPTVATISDLRYQDPATSTAWTAGGVNAMETGMEVA